MRLSFVIDSSTRPGRLEADIHTLIIAGWAGRDQAAVQHHIAELTALGVPPPSTVPLFYRVAANQLVQSESIQVLGVDSSGEVEAFLFATGGETYVTVASDHTDRALEAKSVALAKQVCAKPVAQSAWRLSEVLGHWDELLIRSFIEEDGRRTPYQEGTLATLLSPGELMTGYLGRTAQDLPDGFAMSCGTLSAIGGIRPAASFGMELFDPRTQRTLRHAYTIECLPEIR